MMIKALHSNGWMKVVGALGLALALTAGSTPVLAGIGGGGFDRPDLSEVNDTATFDKKDVYSRVRVRINPQPPSFNTYSSSYYISSFVYGHISAYGYRSVNNNAGFGRFFWWLFEPDTIKRGPEAANKISQSDYLAIGLLVSTNGTYFDWGYSYTTSGGSITSYHLTYPYVVGGCKGDVETKDKPADGDADSAAWNIKCDKDSLDYLKLTDKQKGALKKILGSKNNIKAKGKGDFNTPK